MWRNPDFCNSNRYIYYEWSLHLITFAAKQCFHDACLVRAS